MFGAFAIQEARHNKNTLFQYNEYTRHFVYSASFIPSATTDEQKQFTLDDLQKIPSVIKNFQFFAQPKYRIASWRPGSGNAKNIGSVTKIEQLVNGTGPFTALGEEVYDDYWMFYLTRDSAALGKAIHRFEKLS